MLQAMKVDDKPHPDGLTPEEHLSLKKKVLASQIRTGFAVVIKVCDNHGLRSNCLAGFGL
jgi:hypothetical protein